MAIILNPIFALGTPCLHIHTGMLVLHIVHPLIMIMGFFPLQEQFSFSVIPTQEKSIQ